MTELHLGLNQNQTEKLTATIPEMIWLFLTLRPSYCWFPGEETKVSFLSFLGHYQLAWFKYLETSVRKPISLLMCEPKTGINSLDCFGLYREMKKTWEGCTRAEVGHIPRNDWDHPWGKWREDTGGSDLFKASLCKIVIFIIARLSSVFCLMSLKQS